MRHRTLFVAAAVSTLPLFTSGLRAQEPDDFNTLSARRSFRATLVGDNEVPPVSTEARGTARFVVRTDPPSLQYTVTWEGLRGAVSVSHVHFGPSKVNGGVMFFMCANSGTFPPGTQACPTTSPATITGTITAAEVIGPTGQGISAGEFARALAAIRDGLSYANVHSSMFPGGEIRGQLR